MNKKPVTKILIAGVGGQGVVYLTNLLVDTAMMSDVPVATSEIHGLAQRGGSVTAGLTFGEQSYGFIEKAGADFLLGLEALEAQRCLPFLHVGSTAVIDNNRIPPYSVNAEKSAYPDTMGFVEYLQKHIHQVIFIPEINDEVDPILQNIFVLGCATQSEGFPLDYKQVQQTIKNTAKAGFAEKSLKALELGSTFMVEEVNRI